MKLISLSIAHELPVVNSGVYRLLSHIRSRNFEGTNLRSLLALRHGALSKLHSTEACYDLPRELQAQFSGAIADLKALEFFTDKVELDLTVRADVLSALVESIVKHVGDCNET